MVSSVALTPDNQNEDKHVESKLLPRLDEGSTPSSSTINVDNQCFASFTLTFTHNIKEKRMIFKEKERFKAVLFLCLIILFV